MRIWCVYDAARSVLIVLSLTNVFQCTLSIARMNINVIITVGIRIQRSSTSRLLLHDGQIHFHRRGATSARPRGLYNEL